MIDINDGGELREAATMSFLQKLALGESLDAMKEKLDDPIEWVKRNVGTQRLFRFILSHPARDHMAGLRRLLLAGELGIVNFWDIPHQRACTKDDFPNEEAWLDWASYAAMRADQNVDRIDWPRYLTLDLPEGPAR